MGIKSYDSYFKPAVNSFKTGYDSYTGGLGYSNPFSSYFKSYDKSNVNDAVKTYSNVMQQSYIEEEKQHRTLLDRSFDTLLTPLYASAGFVKGMVDNNDATGQVTPWQGLVGGLKAGNPFGGGNPEGEYTYSRVLESAGWKPESTIGKIAKGTVGFALDMLLDPTTYLTGGASAVLKGTGRTYKALEGLEKLTPEAARPIIEDVAKKRGFPLSTEEAAKDAEDLARQYNKTLGFHEQGDGLTWSLGNFPFGDKIFGKFGEKKFQLASDETLRKFGDDTIAPLYGAVRDSFYNSDIGKWFSTKTPLYKLAQKDPSLVYDTLKQFEMVKKQNIDMLDKQKQIRAIFDQYKDLSPFDKKQIMDLLEDKTIWNRVVPFVKFGTLLEGKQARTALEAERAAKSGQLDELYRIKSDIEELQNHTDEITNAASKIKQLEDEYRQAVLNFDTSAPNVRDAIAHNKLLKDELARLDKNPNLDQSTIDRIDETFNTYRKERRTAARKADVNEAQMRKVTSGMSDDAKAMGDEEIIKIREDAAHGGRTQVIDDLNKYLFGGKRSISYAASDKDVADVVALLKKQDGLKMARAHVEDNPHIFTGMSKKIFGYIAKRLNYESWGEFYTKPMKAYQKKVAKRTMTPEDVRHMNYLESVNVKRAHLKSLFDDAKSPQEVQKVIDHIELQRLYDDLESGDNIFHSDSLRGKSTLERTRESIADDQSSLDASRTRYDPKAKAKDRVEKEADRTTGVNNEFYDVRKEDGSWETRQVERGASQEPVDITKRDINVMQNLAATKLGLGNFAKLNPKQQEFVVSVVKHMPDMVRSMRQPLESFTEKQLDYLFKQAIRETSKRDAYFSENLAKVRGVKTAQSTKSKKMTKEEFRQKLMEDSAKLRAERDLAESTQKRRTDLIKQIEDNEMTIHSYNAGLKSTNEMYTKWIENAKARVDDLVVKAEQFQSKMKSGDVSGIDGLEQEIKKLDDAIRDDDALESYIRMKHGDDYVMDAYKRDNPDVGGIALDADKTFDERVKDIVKALRGHFMEMGEKEVEIGKLTREQFDAMNMNYVPRILTPEGDAFFASKRADELINRNPGLTKDIGYGTSFSGHSRERKITEIKLNGKKIKNPTISQLNEYFAPMLNGKNAYMDDIADLYLARALKNTELVYDDLYMRTMIHQFGDVIKDGESVKNGFKIVSNYGLTKKHMQELASVRLSMHISQDVSRAVRSFVAENSRQAGRSLFGFSEQVRHVPDSEIQRFIEDYMKTKWTPENRKTMFTSLLSNTIEKSGFHEKQFSDLKVPMIEMTREHMDKYVSHYNDVLNTYDDFLKGKEGALLERGADGAAFDRLFKSQEKLEKVSPLQIRQVNDAIVQKANQARKLQIYKDQSDLLQMYDKFTHLIKLNQTTVMPSFHIRNKLANTFLNWLALGRHALNIDLQKNSFATVRSKGKLDGEVRLTYKKPDGTTASMRWNEVYELAKAHNVIDEGFFAKDIGASTGTRGILKGVKPKFDPTDSENFILYRKGGEIGNTIENSDRLLQFAARLQQGHTAEEAGRLTNEFLFDYSDLTAFEQSVMKRLIPFYTWLRKNSALQVEQLLEQPHKYQLIAKSISGVEGMTNQEDRVNSEDISPFFADWVQLPFHVAGKGFTSKDGKHLPGQPQPVFLNTNLPFNDLSRIPDPSDPMQSLKEIFTQLNPLLKVPVEQAANHNVFLDKDIVEQGDNQITPRIDHVLSQSALYGAGKSLASKDTDADLTMQAINLGTGIKTLSYNYDAYKQRRIKELLDGIGK